MKVVSIGAAALAVVMTAAIVPAAAYAAMDEQVVEARSQRPVAYVKYADLNLASADDVLKLNQRVRRAATNICVEYGSRDLVRLKNGFACRDAAIEGAAPQIAAAISKAGDSQLAARSSITVALP